MSEESVNIGEEAPSFCLLDENGEEVCLYDYEGRWLILYFYPKDNTPGCTLEAQNFTEALDDFKDMDAEVVGVSPDDVETHEKFKQLKDLDIKLLSDSEHGVLEEYGVWKPKKMFDNEYFGVIRSTFIINPDSKISHKWEKVKVRGHVDEVKRKLAELKE
ncbi:MAG: peroxiredoxin [Thermoplasmata archaeon]